MAQVACSSAPISSIPARHFAAAASQCVSPVSATIALVSRPDAYQFAARAAGIACAPWTVCQPKRDAEIGYVRSNVANPGRTAT